MDDNNELIIYVLQQLRYGVPEQSIRQTLAQNGWPQPLIDRAFSMVQQAAPHNVPPTDYAQQMQPQMPEVALPTAVTPELPSPAADPYPAIDEMQRNERRSNVMRRLVITISVLVLLAGAAFGGYLLYKAIKQNADNADKPASTIQTKNDDTQRKESMAALVNDLTKYYTEKGTYPTLAQINNPDFASKDKGFNVSKYKDPKWDADKAKACTSQKGQPMFADGRSENCFSYRATASNGGDCDAVATMCSRVVLTANLDGNKPYVKALDKNTEE